MVEIVKSMLSSFDDILSSFDELPIDKRRFVVREMLARLKVRAKTDTDDGLPDFDEETISRLGDELFQMLDEQERQRGAPEPW